MPTAGYGGSGIGLSAARDKAATHFRPAVRLAVRTSFGSMPALGWGRTPSTGVLAPSPPVSPPRPASRCGRGRKTTYTLRELATALHRAGLARCKAAQVSQRLGQATERGRGMNRLRALALPGGVAADRSPYALAFVCSPALVAVLSLTAPPLVGMVCEWMCAHKPHEATAAAADLGAHGATHQEGEAEPAAVLIAGHARLQPRPRCCSFLPVLGEHRAQTPDQPAGGARPTTGPAPRLILSTRVRRGARAGVRCARTCRCPPAPPWHDRERNQVPGSRG